jgi:hypothetical protein
VEHVVGESEFVEMPRASAEPWKIALWDEGLGPDRDRQERLLRRWQREFPATAVVLTTDALTASSALLALGGGASEIVARQAPGDVLGDAVCGARTTHYLRRSPESGGKAPRLLVVGAHPDDCEIGAGGIIHRRVHEGWQVSMLVMSHGAWGGEPDQRVLEARAPGPPHWASPRFTSRASPTGTSRTRRRPCRPSNG